MVRAVEGDDARAAGREQRRPQPDLDRVLARDAELARAQPLAQRCRDRRVGEVTERVDDGLRRPRRRDQRIAVPQRGDAEARREVEVLAPVVVPDAAALGPRPDH